MNEEKPRRILWADDEIDLLRPHIKFLEQKGFSVTPVPNGEDALAELARGRFDVVLLDEMMPGLGGLETLDQIKSRDLGLPVILVTKSEEETLMNEAIGRHITDYLIKPVNPSQVFIACKRVFDAQRLQESQRTRDYVSEMQRWQALDLRALDSEGWINLAVEVARWDVRFDEMSDDGLKQAHGDFRRGLNIEFGRFIEEHYSGWVHGRTARPTLSTDVVRQAIVPHLQQGRRVVFIIIDCMRLDQWFALEPLLESLFELRREHYFSILPTATPYSRNAIFSGLLPAELRQRHPDLWQETNPEERTKNRYERQLLDHQLERLHSAPERGTKYLKIYDADEAHQTRRQINSFSGVPLVSLVFNFLDILAHGRSESEILQELAPDEAAFRAVMKAWFVHSPLYDIFRALASQDCVVVLTTDHGAVLGRRAALIYGNRETSTNLRYKYGTNLNCDAKHAVMVRKPMDFQLPDDGVGKNYVLAREDFYFVYPTRFHEYERQYRGSFQHGGISLEEMILPLVTLTPRRP
ncbi:MAG: bifunctional response regulator/alkaline phosphatase family protein [Candidatus Eisenbacteria bacterium]|uniref:Bifunctional response regulator/alkaline phosphatase family protein n=1 Tax=Eiseniibacteriota bacterium TaxID=2212470 RepID=A0A538SF75_UNCEI|nr:MAG: bifunctional response regulator/alkaline phosphatase family protein [Candidatus Eisenbacteria bacterium]